MNIIAKGTLGALALLALSGCYYYPDRYGYDDRYGGGYYGGDYYGDAGGPGYDAWYDGYYGPYYGGYWGPEGDFYFYDSYHRGHRDYDHHFRHDAFQGGRPYHSQQGNEHGNYQHGNYDHGDGNRWR